jgi:phosphoglycolate phosphatase-like HAD superfamily hydrolase
VPALSPIANHRDPYVVYESTRRALAAVLRELALQPHGHVRIDDVVLDAYPRMMERLLHGASRLSEREIAHARFEDLQADPLGEIERIYRALDLPDLPAARRQIAAYLATIRDYRKADHALSEESAMWQNGAVERLDRTARHGPPRER